MISNHQRIFQDYKINDYLFYIPPHTKPKHGRNQCIRMIVYAVGLDMESQSNDINELFLCYCLKSIVTSIRI